jgi:hypothetical protein
MHSRFSYGEGEQFLGGGTCSSDSSHDSIESGTFCFVGLLANNCLRQLYQHPSGIEEKDCLRANQTFSLIHGSWNVPTGVRALEELPRYTV